MLSARPMKALADAMQLQRAFRELCEGDVGFRSAYGSVHRVLYPISGGSDVLYVFYRLLHCMGRHSGIWNFIPAFARKFYLMLHHLARVFQGVVYLKDYMTLKRFMVHIPSWVCSSLRFMAPSLWFMWSFRSSVVCLVFSFAV